MTTFEIAFDCAALVITLVSVLYMRYLVKTYADDPVDDPELVQRFIEAAPYSAKE
ncbi:hypothetical protein [Phaeobacter sp. NW0010-22]|uniref:hypothetical protein n=1 Tax=Phaeobacter sp. NW0010-22 TaxID=3135907 RepID=UPI0031034424